ncbi:MAG: twin-arginine translocase subunit TatC [Lewinellaceae bacterium]|nr:twin-arginine translocase subunit TatC [Lewinellaceae bacterium]
MLRDKYNIDKQPKEEQTEMSFLDHLDELRTRIINSLVAVALVGIIFWIFNKWLFTYVIFGPSNIDFPTYRFFCSLGQRFCIQPPEFTKQAVGFGESFIISIKASFALGFIAVFPYVFWQFWKFIRPGLHENEQMATRRVVAICSTLFLVGVLFGYFIISPFAISFLMGYTLPGVENIPTVSSYIGYMLMFTAPAGLVFELPVVVYFLARVGLVTPEFMRQYRKHAIVLTLVVAAVLTPPDVMSQMLLGTPLYILYEVSIFIAAWVVRKEKEKEEAEYGGTPPKEQKG